MSHLFNNSSHGLTVRERIELGYELLGDDSGNDLEPEKRSFGGTVDPRFDSDFGMHEVTYRKFRRSSELPSSDPPQKTRGPLSLDPNSGFIRVGKYNVVIDPAGILASSLPDTKLPRGGLVRHNYKH